jgi:hypothetical protein
MDYTVPYGTDLFIAFQAVPACYLRSVPPGQVNSGDPISVKLAIIRGSGPARLLWSQVSSFCQMDYRLKV